VTVFDRDLADTACISCGQCTWVCPVGALIEAPHWHDVLHTLDDRRRTTVVQVAPATRIAIGEEFSMPAGTISTGRMINALRELGFDYVFDTNFAADLTVMEEATELLRARGTGGMICRCSRPAVRVG
jgi:iron only hydrogenase large subunit-like protein